MDHSHHTHAHGHDHEHSHNHNHTHEPMSLNSTAIRATIHCLTGCGIGEVLGMVIGTAMGWNNTQTIIIAIILAFIFGYALTMLPLLKSGLDVGTAAKLALAADTVSIVIMEIIDNAVMMFIPGAMEAPLSSGLFWGSLIGSLIIAGIIAFPVNRWLIARGQGHAVVHGKH